MTSKELDDALERYRAFFGVQGELEQEMCDVARDPFTLRVLSEVCADGSLDVRLLRRDQTPLLKRYLEQKLTALSMHESQMRDSVHHSSVQNVEYTARLRGSEISVEAAEGYMVFRQVLNRVAAANDKLPPLNPA